MPKNLYRLQSIDEDDVYHPVAKDRVNDLVERELAMWVGTDYDEDKDAFVHYADRVE